MKNSFKKILPKHKVPHKIKHKVLLDTKLIINTMKLSDFYVFKYPKTLTDYFIRNK